MTASEDNFADRLCALLTQITSGTCPITEEMIQEEQDPNNASMLAGLQLLWEDLNYQAARRSVAEAELRAREARYRALFAQARVSIWDCDLEPVRKTLAEHPATTWTLGEAVDVIKRARLTSVNHQTLSQFGVRTVGELQDRLDAIFTEASLDLLSHVLVNVAAGERRFETEGLLTTVAGAPMHVVLGISRATEDYSQSIITISDVTPIHQARLAAQENARLRTDELGRVSNEVERLFHAVSHDLRSPLRSVINLVEWAHEDLDARELEAVGKHLEMIQRRVHRLDTMLNDLLSFAHIGRAELPAEEVDVNDLMAELTSAMVSLPEGFEVDWGALPALKTQKTLLSQVLLNLLTNAVKHHEGPAGRVHVSHRWLDCGTSEFSVADNGPGIPAKFRERVFGMFQTLKPRDQIEGSGMGLAFVNKVVLHRGGEIHVTDTPGGGATFVFTWPGASVTRSGAPDHHEEAAPKDRRDAS
ncbi:MAG: HAMP domain-containing sensor histidine kinase [Polyangiaceae bacterium]